MATEEQIICPHCGPVAAPVADGVFCPVCGASIDMGKVRIHVEGQRADEVERVARRLAADEARRASAREGKAALRNPWVAGSFYLVTLVVVFALFFVVASSLPLWALPIVVVGGLIAIVLVGTLQLRQDDRLSEAGFVELAVQVIKQLPRLVTPRRPR